jgi:hypothetical protein
VAQGQLGIVTETDLAVLVECSALTQSTRLDVGVAGGPTPTSAS